MSLVLHHHTVLPIACLQCVPFKATLLLTYFFISDKLLHYKDLLLKMGKVHGSLARAGKVKGQTPKVEAQEDKKKQPRGRAKKRLQYNRRYVNVVTGMGGKNVGPNSNADKMK
ncbi:ribosomal eS30-like protein [Fragilaria crotonensis]|nr:ribosomal eS30-like protein [Fragilaria crotonensis]